MTLSEHNKKRLQQAKKEARNRVIQRGIVEFRADAELMDALIKLSDYKKVPVGTLVRQWIVPIVANELASLPLKEICLQNGIILTANSNHKDLVKAERNYQAHRLKLTAREYHTLINWLVSTKSMEGKSLERIELPNGRILTEDSPYQQLTAAFDEHKSGRIELTGMQHAALVNWTIAAGEKLLGKVS